MNGIEMMLDGGLLIVASMCMMALWRVVRDHESIPKAQKIQGLLVWIVLLIAGMTFLFIGAYKTKYGL